MFVSLVALVSTWAVAQEPTPVDVEETPTEQATEEQEASEKQAPQAPEEPAPAEQPVAVPAEAPAAGPTLGEGDPRTCFPIVVGTRRFRCGNSTGRIWALFGAGVSPSLRGVMSDYPSSRRKLALAEGLKVGGSVVNAGTMVVSGVVLYKVIRNATTGQPVRVTVGEVVVMLVGGIVGSGANQLANAQLENAIDDYNLAMPPSAQWGVSPGAVVGVDGRLVPTMGAQLEF